MWPCDGAFRHILRWDTLGIQMPAMMAACQVQSKWGRSFLSERNRYICLDENPSV